MRLSRYLYQSWRQRSVEDSSRNPRSFGPTRNWPVVVDLVGKVRSSRIGGERIDLPSVHQGKFRIGFLNRSISPALQGTDKGVATRDSGGSDCIGYTGEDLEPVRINAAKTMATTTRSVACLARPLSDGQQVVASSRLGCVC